MAGVVLCPVCVDSQGLPDGSACPRCGSTRDDVVPATPEEVARERLVSRGLQTQATLAALAGLLGQYGLADRFADSLTAIGDAVHRRHNEMAAEL